MAEAVVPPRAAPPLTLVARRPFTSLLRPIAAAVACGITLLGVNQAQAATLSLRASATSVAVGATFTVRLAVNTQGKAINNAEATLTYPRDLVEAVSASRGGSIFQLWIVEPTISAGAGTVSLNGGVPNPGYTGSGGQLATVTFRARRPGTATFGIVGAAVRENDGLGTNILSGSGGVTVRIAEAAERSEEPADEPPPVAGALAISSPTHPEQGSWYSARNLTVSWVVPAGTRGVQVALDESPSGATSLRLPATPAQRGYENVADGVWYFHIRAQTGQGWTRVATFTARIDGTLPQNLAVSAVTSTDGRSALLLHADDATSGVQYYEVRVDGQPPQQIPAEVAKQPVPLPSLTPGQHQVAVVAYDNAGNRAERQETLLILPSAAPDLTYAISKVVEGGRITITGSTAYPFGTVTVVLRSPSGQVTTQDVQADGEGRFTFRSQPVREAGNYQAWAYVSVALRGPSSGTIGIEVGHGGLGAWLGSPVSLLAFLLIVPPLHSVWAWLRLLRRRRQELVAMLTRTRRRR